MKRARQQTPSGILLMCVDVDVTKQRARIFRGIFEFGEENVALKARTKEHYKYHSDNRQQHHIIYERLE